jgi:kanamycin nucleotidyltransferase
MIEGMSLNANAILEPKVSHVERRELAEALTSRMAARYPLLLAGLYGSTTRDEDLGSSDLELWFVVADDCTAQGQNLLYRGISAGYQIYRQSEMESLVTTPSGSWSFYMGVLAEMEILAGDTQLIERWLDLGRTVPKATFHHYLERHLGDYVFESYGRILSCAARQNQADLRFAVQEVLFEMQAVLCMLNQCWVTRDYTTGLRQTFDFPLIPSSYPDLVSALLAAEGFSDTLPAAQQLVTHYLDLLQRQQLSLPLYTTPENIPL